MRATVGCFCLMLMHQALSPESACLAQQASAPPWPRHSVKIVTTQPAGTGVDLTARIYADGFAKRWSQPVVVENRIGADGIMAASSFVAARDDHTLLLSVGAPFTIAPFTNDKLSYDPVTDFTPIALVGDRPVSFNNSLPHHSAKRLVPKVNRIAGHAQ